MAVAKTTQNCAKTIVTIQYVCIAASLANASAKMHQSDPRDRSEYVVVWTKALISNMDRAVSTL